MSRLILPSVRQITGSFLAIIIVGLFITPANSAESDAIQITNLEITAISNFDPLVAPMHLVTLRGTYTNLTNSKIADLDLNLISSEGIRTRGELAEILKAPTNVADLKTSDQSARLRNIPPGETRSWQVSFLGETVLGNDASGVFAIGVEPNESKYGAGSVVTTPWFFNSNIKPTNVALVVPLTTLNSHLATGAVTSEESDLAEVKRISALMRNQPSPSVSWLLDAGLVQWTTELAKQNETAAVKALLESLSALSGSTPVLPFGNTDLSALVRANQQDAVGQALAKTMTLSPNKQIYYLPITGVSDPQTTELLNGLNVSSIISNKSIRGNGHDTTSAVVTSSSNSVLVFDLAASTCLTNIDLNDASFFTSANCVRSEIGMMTAESPQNSRSVIVLAPKDWKISSDKLSALISVLSDHNWMQLTTLDLLATTPATENFEVKGNGDQRELSRVLIKQSHTLQVNTDRLASLYDDPELAAGFVDARILGFSDLWPSESRINQYLTENLALQSRYLNAVQLEASTRITTPKETTEIPITIVNRSDSAVSVGVVLSSNATSRFSAEPTGLVKVEAGKRVTVPVTISLVGAGIVDVQARLVAPNGEKFGRVENIQISSAAYSQFARTLVWGAFGALILLSLSNVLKRRRENHSKTAKS